MKEGWALVRSGITTEEPTVINKWLGCGYHLIEHSAKVTSQHMHTSRAGENIALESKEARERSSVVKAATRDAKRALTVDLAPSTIAPPVGHKGCNSAWTPKAVAAEKHGNGAPLAGGQTPLSRLSFGTWIAHFNQSNI